MMFTLLFIVLGCVLDVTMGCSCAPEPLENIVCRAPFVARVYVQSDVTLENGINYYKIQIRKKGDNLLEGDNTLYAYRSLDPYDTCSGSRMTVGKDYFLTAWKFGIDSHSVLYFSCELTIEWSLFETDARYDTIRNLYYNYTELEPIICG